MLSAANYKLVCEYFVSQRVLSNFLVPRTHSHRILTIHRPINQSINQAPALTSGQPPQDVTGGCERILRTPVPLMYTRHNSRFLLIW